MEKVFLVDGLRSPIGNFGGTLSSVRTDDLAAFVIKSLLQRNRDKIDPNEIEDVIFGCANQAGEDNRNIARMAGLLAGLPVTVGGETVNRLCSSGLASAINASRAIALSDGRMYIAGGVEHMTRAPWVISKASTPFGRDSKMFDTSFGWRFINPKMEEIYGVDGMGDTAENLVDKYDISREDQDQFAYWSQNKASNAQKNGRLSKEIVPIEIPQKKADSLFFDKDEFIKPHTTIEKLSALQPAFRQNKGTVTAGNSSGLNDGACALLLASQSLCKERSLSPLARIVSSAIIGVQPKIMGIGPVVASEKALLRAGLTMKDMDVIELNEAFAAQALSCIRQWKLEDNDGRINPNGGAIAIGHPLGMTGARLLLSASLELKQQNKRYGLVTMCVGVGQGYAAVIENADFY